MGYIITDKELPADRRIQKVYKLADSQNRIRIKWDCLIEDDNDLIVVIRLENKDKNFSISSNFKGNILESINIPKDIKIFAYSRKETDCHIEYDRYNGTCSYYIYPGKLLDNGYIEIIEQKDGKNLVKGTAKANSTTSYTRPEGKLYYQRRYWGLIAEVICSIVLVTVIYSVVDYFGFSLLQHYPVVYYIYFALALILAWIICYLMIPSGNWSKRACLHITGKSRFTDKDMLHYEVSGCNEKYSVRLTDISNDIVIPLNNGEHVVFDNQDIQIKYLSFFEFLYWKYIKKEKR